MGHHEQRRAEPGTAAADQGRVTEPEEARQSDTDTPLAARQGDLARGVRGVGDEDGGATESR